MPEIINWWRQAKYGTNVFSLARWVHCFFKISCQCLKSGRFHTHSDFSSHETSKELETLGFYLQCQQQIGPEDSCPVWWIIHSLIHPRAQHARFSYLIHLLCVLRGQSLSFKFMTLPKHICCSQFFRWLNLSCGWRIQLFLGSFRQKGAIKFFSIDK